MKSFFIINAKWLLVFVNVLGLFFFSCSKENHDVPPSLKQIIANNSSCECNPFIDEYLYKNETVYLQSCGGPACDCTVTFYDSNGERMSTEPGYVPSGFIQESKLVKHVWSCK